MYLVLTFLGSYTKCKGSGKVLDECNRSCECKHGQMVNCKRVRKEFTEMSLDERRRFIRAFKTLASDLRYKKRYEKFVKIHHDYFFKGIYFVAFVVNASSTPLGAYLFLEFCMGGLFDGRVQMDFELFPQ